MNRRAFLRKPTQPVLAATVAVAAGQPPLPAAAPADETVSPYANRQLPAVARTTTGLSPYTGPWTAEQAAHLLRRTMFGPTRAEIAEATALGLTAVVDRLLTPAPTPEPPLNVVATDTTVPIGQTWVGQAFDQTLEGVRRASLRAWWLGQLVGQGMSLTEKMTLFWHNRLVIELGDINDARYGYLYVALLRQQALGNARQLVKDVTVTPAMLRYLNGNQSTATAPNENYGRELLELFTVGKGPLIAPGNYTYYTENDVKATARVLTGWRDSNTLLSGYFTASRHDTTAKQFSAAFGNRIITNGGDQEYKTLVDMVFAQPETARNLCRALYRWFVYYVIDDATETNVIQPLAALLVQSNYEVTPVLRALLLSEHFHDPANVGCLIKSPLDFSVTLPRQLQAAFPPATSPTVQYGIWDYLNSQTNVQQQQLGDPPNVAGWAAYYQTPQYHELWINAVTLPRRNQLADLLASTGYTRNGFKLVVDPLALTQGLPAATAADPNLLVSSYARLLFPISLTSNQLAFLKEALIPGLPDFEWTVEWNGYLAAPTNAAKKAAVLAKLQALLRAALALAEYHLS